MKEEVLQVIKEFIAEGVLYVDTEVYTTPVGYDSFGNGEGGIGEVEVSSSLEIKDVTETVDGWYSQEQKDVLLNGG